ncbi:hypothetical protein CTI14_63615, partial [Methylobacterium radiotolerans]
RDLRQEPLTVRRALLQQLMDTTEDDHLRFSEALEAAPSDLVASARKISSSTPLIFLSSGSGICARNP